MSLHCREHDTECQGAASGRTGPLLDGAGCDVRDMSFLSAMGILVEHPWLTALPTVLFFLLFKISNSRMVLAVALLWLAYLPYEYAMKFRILCSGECNIRVDLLLIYPALILSSLVGLGFFALGYGRKSHA
jgi:hypothetical protein